MLARSCENVRRNGRRGRQARIRHRETLRASRARMAVCAVPERISLPGVSKKSKKGGGGRGSPMQVDGEEVEAPALPEPRVMVMQEVWVNKLLKCAVHINPGDGERFLFDRETMASVWAKQKEKEEKRGDRERRDRDSGRGVQCLHLKIPRFSLFPGPWRFRFFREEAERERNPATT